jgi:hypothetical protein
MAGGCRPGQHPAGHGLPPEVSREGRARRAWAGPPGPLPRAHRRRLAAAIAGRHRPAGAARAAEFGARPRAFMSGRSIRCQPGAPGTVAGGAAGTRTRTAAVPGHTPRGSSRCNRPKSGQGEAFGLGENRLDDGNGWGCGRGGHGALPGRAEARKAGLAVAPATVIHPNRQLAPMITQSSCILLSGARSADSARWASVSSTAADERRSFCSA